MIIRRSSAREVESLIARLDSPNAIERDAAVARLRIIGSRAIPHLTDASQAPSARTRVAALHVLEAVPDRRSVAPLIALLSHDDVLTAVAAAAALRPLIATAGEDRVIDALVDAVMNERRDPRVRHAALRALSELGTSTLTPLLEQLGQRPLPADLRRAAESYDAAARAASVLPDDPTETRRMLAKKGTALSIADLFRVVSALRGREAAEPQVVRRMEWMTARAVAHQTLAARGSRVALYDLRETLETATGPLPVEFLAAVERIGDATCAAAIVAAYANASPRDWWSDHLASSFRAIARRERLTRRSAALQRAARKCPQALEELFDQAATTGNRKPRRS